MDPRNLESQPLGSRVVASESISEFFEVLETAEARGGKQAPMQ